MSRQILLTLAIAATLGLNACGPSEEPEQTTAEPGDAAPAQPSLIERAAEAAREATQVAREKLEAVATAGSEAAGTAREKGGEITQAAVDKASDLIQQVKDYIAEQDLDLAGSAMEQLRTLRDSLPQGLQDEIDKLDAMLTGMTEREPSAGD